jgi:hypothetical protein
MVTSWRLWHHRCKGVPSLAEIVTSWCLWHRRRGEAYDPRVYSPSGATQALYLHLAPLDSVNPHRLERHDCAPD